MMLCWIYDPLRPGDKYMHQCNVSSLVQLLVWHLSCAKPLPEPILTYCWLDLKEWYSMKFWSEYNSFLSGKCISKCHLQNVSHFVLSSMSYTLRVLQERTLLHMIPDVLISLFNIVGPKYADNIFKFNFLNENYINLIQIAMKLVPKIQQVNIGISLVSNM